MRRLLFICGALVFFGVIAHAQQPAAAELLAKVASTYANALTYSDEGTSASGGTGRTGLHSHFRISFVRPNSLVLEVWIDARVRDGSNSWIVWKEGDSIRTSSPLGFDNRSAPLDTALSRLTFLCGGSSQFIPQLLLPDSFRNADLLSLIVDARVAGEDKIDGHPTFRVEGNVFGEPVKLWIDKARYVILKTHRKAHVAGHELEATVNFKPVLDSDIPPERLVFRPPANQPTSPSRSSTPTAPSEVPGQSPRLREFGFSLSRPPGAKAVSATERSDDEDVVRVDTDLVVCPVLVLDAQGKIVTGLTRADFLVTEDNQPQEIGSFSLGDSKDVPRSIVLIIDYSGSQLPYIKTSIEAAKTLVDKLNPKDRMAIVTDDVKLLVDFTNDKELLKQQLDTLKTSALSGVLGLSEQYDALMATLNELFNREDVRPIIIFQTDGDELDSLNGSSALTPYSLPRKYSYQNLLTATEKSRVTIYSVISGVQFAGVPDDQLLTRARTDWENRETASGYFLTSRSLPSPKQQPSPPLPGNDILKNNAVQWQRRQLALVGIAKYTGAWAEFLESPDQADEIYTRVLTDIDRRYVVGYYPTNRARDGKRRKVKIEVRNHPEYLVWGQRSYFAREEK
jgi:VWFA-related protein